MQPSTKLSELCDRIQDLPDKATSNAYTSFLVIVPHHDLTGAVTPVIHEAFRDFGYAVDKVTKTEVRGDEFRVMVRPINGLMESAKGLKIHVLCIPSEEGLTGIQKQTLKRMMVSLQPVVLLADEIIEY